MTLNVTKRNGTTEPFDRNKLVLSIRLAGAEEERAQEIADSFLLKNNMPTDEIREHVTRKLSKHNPVQARRYQRTLRFAAQEVEDAVEGFVEMAEDALRRLGAQVGEKLRLTNGDQEKLVTVKRLSTSGKAMKLHRKDLEILCCQEGTKLAVKKDVDES